MKSRNLKLFISKLLMTLAIPASLLLPVSALAEDVKNNNTSASMQKLIVASKADIMAVNMVKQHSMAIIDESLAAIIRSKKLEKPLTENQTKQLTELSQKNAVKLFNDVSTEETQAKIFGLYMHLLNSAYTQGDIEAQTEFFQTEAGNNFQIKQPQVIQAFGVNSFKILFNQSKDMLDKDLGPALEKEVSKILEAK